MGSEGISGAIRKKEKEKKQVKRINL